MTSATVASPGAKAAAEGWDLIVIGAGTAGLPAATFAARRGLRVLLLDAAPDLGGTLHLAFGQVSGAGTRIQAAKGIDDSPDRHFADVMALSEGRADRDIVRLTVDNAASALNWLLDNGLVPLPHHPVTGDNPARPAYSAARYFWGARAGRDILAVMRREIAPEIARGQVAVRYETRATALLASDRGAVEAVRADGPDGTQTYRGRQVLLATGGYAMNPERFAQWSGGPAYAAGSYPFSQGDGLAMAVALGAALRGQELHRAGSGSILSAERFPAQVYARFITRAEDRPPWEIHVNNAGRRFIREDEPLLLIRERALRAQPDFRYAIVFDEAILQAAPPGIKDWDRDKLRAHFGTHPMFHRADSLAELAAKAGIEAQGLAETVTAYNAGVRSGSDPLGRQYLPREIATPPFYAVIHLGHSATSATGVTVDRRLRVLRRDGSAIPGLYAAGEILGSAATMGDAFAPGMMLTPAIALGRLLGETLPARG